MTICSEVCSMRMTRNLRTAAKAMKKTTKIFSSERSSLKMSTLFWQNIVDKEAYNGRRILEKR